MCDAFGTVWESGWWFGCVLRVSLLLQVHPSVLKWIVTPPADSGFRIVFFRRVSLASSQWQFLAGQMWAALSNTETMWLRSGKLWTSVGLLNPDSIDHSHPWNFSGPGPLMPAHQYVGTYCRVARGKEVAIFSPFQRIAERFFFWLRGPKFWVPCGASWKAGDPKYSHQRV